VIELLPYLKRPTRIISLVPSQTELLFDLGLQEEVVGITKFCIHPTQWFRHKKRVGGTKTIDISSVRALQPDLILANKEENTQADIEALSKEFPVWVSDIKNVQDALDMIAQVGELVNRKEEAQQLIDKIQKKMTVRTNQNSIDALYLIWQKPYMAAGADTFIHDMMSYAGMRNVVTQMRYPTLTMEEIIALQPAYVLLSSEPFPFKQKHVEEMQASLPDVKIILVDGELFSWYGSRMLQSFDYFYHLHEQIQNS